MHRFYVPGDQPPGSVLEFTPAQAKQIARVLRMRPGEQVESFDGAGTASTVALTEVGLRRTTGLVQECRAHTWPFPWQPVLYLALIRPQRFEWAVEKASELGVRRIVPLNTARVTHGDDSVSPARQARLQQIAVEAAAQCGSTFVPELCAPMAFAEALQEHAGLRLLAWEDQTHRLSLATPADAIRAGLPSIVDTSTEIAVYIGPEGGFEQAEIEMAVEAGCHLVTLGPRVLRAETAVVVALAMLIAAAGDRGGPASASADG